MKLYAIFVFFYFISVRGEDDKSRLVGGDAIQINTYPYSTALLTNRGTGTTFTQACGGTILTNNAILSAASCFFTNNVPNPAAWWRARVGTAFSNRGGTVHILSRIGSHPDFSPQTRANDIAVLRTAMTMNLQWGFAEPARIAGAVFQLGTHQPIWAIGWGITGGTALPAQQLKTVQFWVVDQQTCTNRYAATGFTVTPNMVCTGWLDMGIRAQCEGDAGSPIIQDGVVVGVHSWAQGCADPWFPGVNTRVAPYTRWIVAEATA